MIPRSRRPNPDRPDAGASGRPRSVAYLVHNVADAAVIRRVASLRSMGIHVTVIGFRRSSSPADHGDGTAVDLGRTEDGRLIKRMLAVVGAMARFGKIRRATARADVVIARNLEMLVLGARAARGRRLVYECLDIHRTLLEDGRLARLVQRIERALLRRTQLIVTSSPRFEADYFAARRQVAIPVFLAENKVPADAAPASPTAASHAPGAPWVIGWFGMLRCRKSLAMLARIAAESEGRVEVVIAGIPSDAEFSGFAEQVAAMPGVRYVGAYTGADLPRLYGSVDFAWAIDYFEEGLNSSWLLPNRLYESLAYRAVPIALADVETGRWLAKRAIGIVVEDPVAQLGALLARLGPAEYDRHARAVAALPRDTVVASDRDNRALAEALFTG